MKTKKKKKMRASLGGPNESTLHVKAQERKSNIFRAKAVRHNISSFSFVTQSCLTAVFRVTKKKSRKTETVEKN